MFVRNDSKVCLPLIPGSGIYCWIAVDFPLLPIEMQPKLQNEA